MYPCLDCISIADNIATAFQLRPYTHVTVSKVDPKVIVLVVDCISIQHMFKLYDFVVV